MRLVMTLAVSLLVTGVSQAGEQPAVIPLWSGGAPGSEGKTDPELIVEQSKTGGHDRRVSRIHNPTLTVYLPPRDQSTGAAVVICPGGAHRVLAIDHEGYEVAEWLNSIGVAAMVLKYRLAQTPNAGYKVDPHALNDAQRALRLVRSHASEWGIDTKRVGILGFSAGGEVAALAGTKIDEASAGAADPVDRLSARPDFMALVYPGAKAETLTITKQAPPVFLLVADDDRIADRSLALYHAFKKAGVSTELHVYARGGHGFGMHKTTLPVARWTARLEDWMADRGLLKKG